MLSQFLPFIPEGCEVAIALVHPYRKRVEVYLSPPRPLRGFLEMAVMSFARTPEPYALLESEAGIDTDPSDAEEDEEDEIDLELDE